METLKNELKAMVEHCEKLPRHPTSEQLTGKTTAIGGALEKDAVTLPKRIKEIISEGFEAVLGWDLHKRAVKDTSKFTCDNLVHALKQILEEVTNWTPPVQPTSEELASLSAACNRLWELDIHRLVPDRDYAINIQSGKYVYDNYDAAEDPLFTFVDEKILEKPTFAAFIALLDNYVAELGTAEVVTAEERTENKHFLNVVMDTAVMQYVHQYLLAKGKTKAVDRDAFIQELNDLWFALYRRKVAGDSSGFEHVFLGEIKEDTNEVTGFHNWIQLYLEEKKKSFDYQGYIKPKRRGHAHDVPHSFEQFISLQFKWKGYLKKVSSSFVGVSPEFELALYTLCYLLGEQQNTVQCGPYAVNVTCYKFPETARPGQRQYIGSAFPQEAPASDEGQRTSPHGKGGAPNDGGNGGNNNRFQGNNRNYHASNNSGAHHW